MKKLLTVVKREYIQRVRSRMFVVATILAPAMMAMFTIVPAYLAAKRVGGPTRVAVIDQSGKLYERFRDALLESSEENDEGDESAQTDLGEQANLNQRERMTRAARSSGGLFTLQHVELDGRSLEQARRELSERVRRGEIDVYVVIPKDILATGKAEFYGRNTGDIFTRETIARRLSNAVRDQRLADEHISQNVVRELNRRVELASTRISESGEEKDSGSGFFLVFGVGFLIYLTTVMYGQTVLAAVIEEKETRIAEILFSSIKPFPLLMGKLIGVSLVALTQIAIWLLALIVFSLFGVGMLAAQGVSITLPHIPPIIFVYFALYFLLGYFVYATIYALIGSMVTTTQEGGQIALPVVLLLVVGFYLAFPVIRSPNSSLAFWASLFPFFAPITMLVRIVTETPPFWQIALSLAIGFATVVGLIWVAARIYRVGMLMTGKRASIPEVWRWVRRA